MKTLLVLLILIIVVLAAVVSSPKVFHKVMALASPHSEQELKTDSSAQLKQAETTPNPEQKSQTSGTTQNPPKTQAVPTPSPTPEPKLPPEILKAVVTISGSNGAGTGFICNFKGKTYVATNQHVLRAGSLLTIRTSNGDTLTGQQAFAAFDADIALIQCASIPAGIKPLEIATLPDSSIQQGDSVMVPGNSKGDGVITQTPGKLLAIGPQRVEVDNPIYPGNSGSPIFHLGSNKVIGILTESELLTLNPFEKASFQSKNSAIKSEIRYFGHRIDSVQKWEGMNWQTFQQTELLIKQSRTELNDILAYLTDSSASYKDFKDLHVARNNAVLVFTDKKRSIADKKQAYDRFLRDIEGLAKRAKFRLAGRKIYFSQASSMDAISKLSDGISGGTDILKRDNELLATLLQRGN